MKKLIIILSFCIFSIKSFSNVEVYLMYSVFNSPEGPYIETYLSTIGKSLVFKKTDNNLFQAEIEVVIMYKKGESIESVDKYRLLSPEISDTMAAKPNFLDIQRERLPNGIYNFEIIIKDVNSDIKPSIFSDIININFDSNKIGFGGIQYIEKISASLSESALSKSGYDIVPYVSNFFPSNVEKLSFYMEIYNADVVINDDFIVRYYIENYETGKEIEKFSRYKRMVNTNIIPFIGDLNIKDLQSGNYNLVVEVKNRENKSIEKVKYFFQRSNNIEVDNEKLLDLVNEYDIYSTFSGEMTSRDSVVYYISSLRPIANISEQRFIDYQMKESSLDVLQKFFVQFWISRNNVNPNEIWKEYNKQVEYINKLFQTKIRKGFETDMGITYLKYGAPTSVYSSKHEPSSYPYEIWTYWKAGNETNRKFVFYNPDIVGKEYELLHSNATGEIKTNNWERLLQKRNSDMYNFDDLKSDDSWGSRALEEFNR